MHLEQQLRAGWHEGRGPLRMHVGRIARRVTAQAGHHGIFAAGFANEDDDVMHNRGVAGARLSGLHPFVFGPARVDREVLVFDGPLGRHVVGFFAHVDDLVGLADAPPLGVLARGGELVSIPFGTAVFDPGRDQLLFFVGEPRVVAEMAMRGLAYQGGMRPSLVTSRIISAQPTSSSYDCTAKGATSPSRWHTSQRFCMIRAI